MIISEPIITVPDVGKDDALAMVKVVTDALIPDDKVDVNVAAS